MESRLSLLSSFAKLLFHPLEPHSCLIPIEMSSGVPNPLCACPYLRVRRRPSSEVFPLVNSLEAPVAPLICSLLDVILKVRLNWHHVGCTDYQNEPQESIILHLNKKVDYRAFAVSIVLAS
ncbi:MAG TPA: hypothetical protein IAD17_01310 [Candidatus Coprovicinus avistercoris]|uniref:Uncharacterized protein n=1 Tax=Candidatus Coprovicinus avistercoris TaxID=2840754 RepID=A0A9D1HYF2_9ACTN|nr:hypothetical protein [Candidatus Coprovicinus avistercoris]